MGGTLGEGQIQGDTSRGREETSTKNLVASQFRHVFPPSAQSILRSPPFPRSDEFFLPTNRSLFSALKLRAIASRGNAAHLVCPSKLWRNKYHGGTVRGAIRPSQSCLLASQRKLAGMLLSELFWRRRPCGYDDTALRGSLQPQHFGEQIDGRLQANEECRRRCKGQAVLCRRLSAFIPSPCHRVTFHFNPRTLPRRV